MIISTLVINHLMNVTKMISSNSSNHETTDFLAHSIIILTVLELPLISQVDQKFLIL